MADHSADASENPLAKILDAALGEFVDERTAACLIGKSPQTLRAWRVARTNLPYHRLGRSIRYRRADIRAFIDAARVEVGAKVRS